MIKGKVVEITSMATLVVTAVEAEKEAVVRGLPKNSAIEVIVGGVGIAQMAANTAVALSQHTYQAVVNVGIAGGFVEEAPVGSFVVANEIIAADLGAESEKGFLSLEELDLGVSRLACDQTVVERSVRSLEKLRLDVTEGAILTTTTVTGTASRAKLLKERFPTAKAEAMEGYGVLAAARLYNVPAFEWRSISNVVGPRDREKWKIKEALALLEQAAPALVEVFS